MLGNWSFGSHQQQLDPENHPPPEIAGGSGYGRAEACRFAWAFLTDELGLDPRSLYVTYFVPDVPGGEEHQRRQGKGKGQTLAADLETREIWLQIGSDKKNWL